MGVAMLGTHPTLKPNPNPIKTRACSICGTEIHDAFADVPASCAKSDKNLCKECGRDICFVNSKHKVVDRFCTDCNQSVARQAEYQRWINSKLPFCDAKIEKID
jgi:hypothetical protein